MQNQQKLMDYGSRAVHEMTVKGKALINAYYAAAEALGGCRNWDQTPNVAAMPETSASVRYPKARGAAA